MVNIILIYDISDFFIDFHKYVYTYNIGDKVDRYSNILC